VIYVKGCIEQGDIWFQQYMIPVAGVIVGTAVLLVTVCSYHNISLSQLVYSGIIIK